MTPTGQTLCLSMIVKNEAPVIRRCLASVRSLVDHWVIVDTGSTDGTQAIVREAMAGLPGTLVERPWKDFGHNRSEALALARPHGDYSLVIDADDALDLPAGFARPALTADSYSIDIQDASIAYRRTQIVRNTLPWVYRGVLHEFMACDAAESAEHLPIIMRRNHDGARRKDPQTYRRDAAVLERALAEETDPFLVSRYTFYLAQSYRDCHEPQKAIEQYLRRADLGFWTDEIYVGLTTAAQLMAGLGRPDEEVLATFRRATAVNPARAEARHHASRHCRLKNRFADGFAAAADGLHLTPPADGLFVETWVYDYGLRDEYAVNAYWAGHHRECLSACLDLLARAALPQGMRERVVANARFALDKLVPAKPAPVPHAVPRGWVPDRPQGGTELMVEGLRQRLGSALDAIDLRINLFGDAHPGRRPLVLWMHHNTDQAAVAWLDDRTKADRVAWFVFVSDWQRARYLDRFGLRPERCVVLRNATAVPAGRERGPGCGPLKVGYASVPYRGLSVLLDAWDRLRPRGAELHIWSSHKLYGADFDDAPYQRLYDRAAALPGVVSHGIVPNAALRTALGDLDILGYPSIFEETSCLSVIEAMAAGCRVVCSALGALPETTAGFARLYPFDPDPVAHAARFAENLGEEIAAPWDGDPGRAEAQRAFCQKTYDWTVRVAEWRDFLARVAAPSWHLATTFVHRRV